MKLHHEFEVDVDPDTAWQTFADLERLAPCMPGATLDGRDGNAYTGSVRIKLGPIGANYRGAAIVEDADRDGRRIVIRARGSDTRGQGDATAVITARFVGSGTGSTVNVDTELTITGKVAQFGRGVIPDVSDKLFSQFAEGARGLFSSAGAPNQVLAPLASTPGVDLLSLAAVPAVRRRLLIGGLAALLLVVALTRRRRGNSA